MTWHTGVAARRLNTGHQRLLGMLDLAAWPLSADGVATDAYVHADLVGTCAEGGGAVNEGLLFRIEAGTARLVALAVVLADRNLCCVSRETLGALHLPPELHICQ